MKLTHGLLDQINEVYHIQPNGVVYRLENKKVMSQSTCRNGYRRIWLTINKKRHVFGVHQLVAFKYNWKTYQEGFEVNHIDGNKSNNSLDNFEWVSKSENRKKAFKEKPNDFWKHRKNSR